MAGPKNMSDIDIDIAEGSDVSMKFADKQGNNIIYKFFFILCAFLFSRQVKKSTKNKERNVKKVTETMMKRFFLYIFFYSFSGYFV